MSGGSGRWCRRKRFHPWRRFVAANRPAWGLRAEPWLPTANAGEEEHPTPGINVWRSSPMTERSTPGYSIWGRASAVGRRTVRPWCEVQDQPQRPARSRAGPGLRDAGPLPPPGGRQRRRRPAGGPRKTRRGRSGPVPYSTGFTFRLIFSRMAPMPVTPLAARTFITFQPPRRRMPKYPLRKRSKNPV